MNDDLDTGHGKLSAADAHQARQRLASDHAALFPTRLALARWTRGGDLPHLHTGAPPLRAAWYARAVREHQAWLDRGGFAQHETPCVWPAPDPLPQAVPLPVAPSRPALDGGAQPADTCA